jgi:hypothetical protein
MLLVHFLTVGGSRLGYSALHMAGPILHVVSYVFAAFLYGVRPAFHAHAHLCSCLWRQEQRRDSSSHHTDQERDTH